MGIDCTVGDKRSWTLKKNRIKMDWKDIKALSITLSSIKRCIEATISWYFSLQVVWYETFSKMYFYNFRLCNCSWANDCHLFGFQDVHHKWPCRGEFMTRWLPYIRLISDDPSFNINQTRRAHWGKRLGNKTKNAQSLFFKINMIHYFKNFLIKKLRNDILSTFWIFEPTVDFQ